MSLLPLDAHHLVNRISDVEDLKVLPELIGFDLSEVEQILNDEIHELSGVLLNYSAFIQRFKDVHAAFVGVRVLYFRIKLLELLLQLVVHRRFLNILGNYWVERVSKLMRNARINKRGELILNFVLFIKDVICDVDNL